MDIEVEYREYLDATEDLARRFLHLHNSDEENAWTFQLELFNCLLKIQKERQETKRVKLALRQQIAEIAKNKDVGWKSDIQELQIKLKYCDNRREMLSNVHGLVRQIGDAVAWTLLQYDEKFIVPLTRNKVVPSVTSGLSFEGLKRAGELLGLALKRVPILHDITHCLRVGDITLVDINSDPLTVEVKTKELSRESDHIDLSVTVHLVSSRQEDIEEFKKSIRDLSLSFAVPINPDPVASANSAEQFIRQLERMAKASSEQRMEHGDITELSETSAAVQVGINTVESFTHIQIVEQLARDAREDGLGSRVVDDTFVYIARYDNPPEIVPWHVDPNESGSMADDFAQSIFKIMRKDFPLVADSEENVLWFGVVENPPPYLRPILLWELSEDSLIDLLCKRLSVWVFVNLGKLASCLRNAGFEVGFPETTDGRNRDFLVIKKSITDEHGVLHSQLKNLHMISARLIYDFLSCDGFAEIIKQMYEAVEDHMKEKRTTL